MKEKPQSVTKSILKSIKSCPTRNSSEKCYEINVFNYENCAYQDFDTKEIIRLKAKTLRKSEIGKIEPPTKTSYVSSASCWVSHSDDVPSRAYNMTQSIYFPTDVCRIEYLPKKSKDGVHRMRIKCREGKRNKVIHVPNRRYGYIIPKEYGLGYEKGITPPLVKKAMRKKRK